MEQSAGPTPIRAHRGPPDVVQVERILTELVRPELEQAAGPVDPDRTFTDLGLDSTGVLAVCEGLKDELRVDLVADAFFDHPTISRLAAHLSSADSDTW